MKHLRIPPLMAATAVALSLVLGGCGGSSSTTPDPAPMPDPGIAQLEAVEMAASTAATAVTTLDSADAASITAAEAAVDGLMAALAAATDVDSATLAGYRAQLSTAQAAVQGAKDAYDAAMDAEEMADQMALNAMARKLHTGLRGIDSTVTVADGAVTSGSVTGIFDTDGTDTTESPQASLVVEASGTDTPSAGGWGGTDYVHTNDDETVTNHVVVYSNPGDDVRMPFEEKHADIITDATGEVPLASFGSFKIAGSDFASGAGSKDHPIPEDADYVSVRGTFDGAPGSFRCSTADGCESAVDDSTGVKLTGTWWFVADSGAETVTPDANYVVFGWWARDAGTSVRVATFVSEVGTVAASADIIAVEGTATYSGGAAGKVAVYDPLLDANNAAGAFTADATFTAEFGNETAGGTISGTIDNFSVAGESKDWSVALKEADITDSGDATFGEATNGTTWTIGGVDAADSGNWSGGMYDTDSETDVPQSLTGQFQSTYRNIGEMVGAFGADLDD